MPPDKPRTKNEVPRPGGYRATLPSVREEHSPELLDVEEDEEDSALRAADSLTLELAERARTERALRERVAQLEAEKAVKVSPPAQVSTSEAADAQQVKAITVNGRRLRVAIPVAAIVALIPPVKAAVEQVVAVVVELRETRKLLATYQAQFTAHEQAIASCDARVTTLTTDVARLSGFLSAALPKAGLALPPPEPGSLPVDIRATESNAARKPAVRLGTPVPAPTPQRKP